MRGVFKFALLDALARAGKNNNGLIEWAELIQRRQSSGAGGSVQYG